MVKLLLYPLQRGEADELSLAKTKSSVLRNKLDVENQGKAIQGGPVCLNMTQAGTKRLDSSPHRPRSDQCEGRLVAPVTWLRGKGSVLDPETALSVCDKI